MTMRLRSIRMKPGFALDSLTNAITGMGTIMDPREASFYTGTHLSQQTIAAAYRGSGLMRKIINIPPIDMVREWRDWKAEDDQITALEREENRHMLRQKIKQVEILRGLGGGALVMGLPGEPETPAPTTIRAGDLAFIHVVSRWQLTFTATQDDTRLPGYGEPMEYRMETTAGSIRLHPSRVIPFRAEMIPPVMGITNFIEDFWGESRVAAVLDAVKDCDTARAALAQLINKARHTRVGIPNLLDSVSTTEGEAAFRRRMSVFTLAESIYNATIYDAGDGDNTGETITDTSYNFAGIKDVLNAFGEWVSAVSDIPATRLLGRAPEGMNASGESQQEDWNKKIRAMQTLDLAPCLEKLDAYLVQSALGTRPAEVWYEFVPLDMPSQKDQADRFDKQMQAVERLQNTGAIPDEAFAKGVQSLMIDEGYMPGLEQALAEMPEDERYGVYQSMEGGDPLSAGAGGSIGSAPPDRALNDATPRPLYVRRDLLNASELIAWAKSQGLETTLPASDMHVTILYSRTAVDPMKMGESWGNDESGGIVVKAGGPRALERFGEGALVLQFASWDISSRHADMIRAGGSHDWPEYLPHVTITYSVPDGLDVSAIRPYAGELRFGPEIFEPLDLDWKSKIKDA